MSRNTISLACFLFPLQHKYSNIWPRQQVKKTKKKLSLRTDRNDSPGRNSDVGTGFTGYRAPDWLTHHMQYKAPHDTEHQHDMQSCQQHTIWHSHSSDCYNITMLCYGTVQIPHSDWNRLDTSAGWTDQDHQEIAWHLKIRQLMSREAKERLYRHTAQIYHKTGRGCRARRLAQ